MLSRWFFHPAKTPGRSVPWKPRSFGSSQRWIQRSWGEGTLVARNFFPLEFGSEKKDGIPYHKNQPNVGKSTLHGSCGDDKIWRNQDFQKSMEKSWKNKRSLYGWEAMKGMFKIPLIMGSLRSYKVFDQLSWGLNHNFVELVFLYFVVLIATELKDGGGSGLCCCAQCACATSTLCANTGPALGDMSVLAGILDHYVTMTTYNHPNS